MDNITTTLTPRQQIFARFLVLRGLDQVISDEPGMAQKVRFISNELAEDLKDLLESVRRRYFPGRTLTMRDVKAIANDRGITLTATPRDAKANPRCLGYYHADRVTNYREIYISPKLGKRAQLMVAAHELAHHFLHDARMLQQGSAVSTAFIISPIATTAFLTEMETDTLAALFLSGDTTVPTPEPLLEPGRICRKKLRKALAGGSIDAR
jgi:Zn-dependent peptidase ImmA (M78 family)